MGMDVEDEEEDEDEGEEEDKGVNATAATSSIWFTTVVTKGLFARGEGQRQK
ncbi:hypothetical protein ACRALDRAFT_211909 [Sodiomyces alcalophilus JCM 7366]|uniref:uncharacterized protein n=1 Tax=Sodiomyces alcalophilus JCM 7366 TaxID=591952 RepID=UPI0039B6A0B7